MGATTGRLDVSDSELKLGGALNISGTLAANSASQWGGWSGSLDLTAGTLEAGGGSLSLSDFTTGAGTTLKLSADTEITSTTDYTFGTVDLAGKKLTLGGNGGLILPNALTMAAGSKIETKTSDLTLSSALQLGTGSITSTGGTLSFAGGLTVGGTGSMSVLDSILSVSQNLNFTTTASFESSVLDLQGATTLTSNGLVSFKKVNLNNKVLTLGSAGTHLKLTDSNETLSLNNLALETGAGSLTLAGPLSVSYTHLTLPTNREV